MKTKKWFLGITLPHDPNSTEDYELDMTDVVADDTATAASVIAVGVTATLSAYTSTGVLTYRVSGGTVGETSSVTGRVTTSSGRVQDRTVNFKVTER